MHTHNTHICQPYQRDSNFVKYYRFWNVCVRVRRARICCVRLLYNIILDELFNMIEVVPKNKYVPIISTRARRERGRGTYTYMPLPRAYILLLIFPRLFIYFFPLHTEIRARPCLSPTCAPFYSLHCWMYAITITNGCANVFRHFSALCCRLAACVRCVKWAFLWIEPYINRGHSLNASAKRSILNK